MHQATLTEYFSTRKRNRFNNEDALLNKQKSTQLLMESTTNELNSVTTKHAKLEGEVTTRSRTRLMAKLDLKKLEDKDNAQIQNTKVENVETKSENELDGRKTRLSNRKKQLEDLKQKVSRLDDKINKINEIPQQKQPEVQPEPQPAPSTTKTTNKKKVNLAELKAKIQDFNQKLIAIQENADKHVEPVQAAKPTTIEPALSAAAAPATDNNKTIEPFQKFKDLQSTEIDLKCTLTLPVSYGQLLDSFKASDTIVKFLFNRQETCTFLKLKMGIQNITKHNFYLKNLGQFKTVYPVAYVFKQEKMFIDFKNDFHLTIYPNLEELDSNAETGLKEFTPAVLLKRINAFKSSLFDLVKGYHQKFLASIGLTSIDKKDIKRWHPKFDLESLKEIEESELPKSPNEQVKTKTAQDLLSIAKTVHSTRIEKAIKEYITEEKSTEIQITKTETNTSTSATSTTTSTSTTTATTTTTTKEKIPNYSSLLEKIRSKEKAKAFETMVLNNDKEKSKSKYENYKETIRFLLNFFQTEKKSTLESEKIAMKMSDYFKDKLNEMECRTLLADMCNNEQINVENGKKWLNTITVRKINYIQMDKSFKLNDLWSKCDKIAESV